jgi:hypothetical protein
MVQAVQNYNITFSFSGLLDNTMYTFFYFATTEDPTISAQSSTVNTFNAQTLQALIVDINYIGKISTALLLLILVMILQL